MKIKRVLVIILLLISITIPILVKSGIALEFDKYILNRISLIRTGNLTNIITILTDLMLYIFIPAFIFVVIKCKNKNIIIMSIINSVGIFILNRLLKLFFNVARLMSFMIINESGYSFPSAHAMVSTCVYLFLCVLVYKNIDKKYLKYSIICILLMVILFLGFSRMYLGVHYPTDIIEGQLIGSMVILLEVIYFKEWKYGKSIRSKKI